jgi:D-glycero-beta-D-manno-heptose 1-phosphate adenylyltransferase
MRAGARTISSWDDAADLARTTQRQGGKVVFTNGVFDLLHPGHVRYLRDARAMGTLLVVAINSDRSVRANKGPGRPITPAAERAEVLLALASVDAVVIFDEDTPHDVIDRLQPDVLIKGEDWAADAVIGRDLVEARGGRVVRVRLEPGLSTTELIRRIRRE